MEDARALDHLVSRFSVLGAVLAAILGAAQPGCSSKGLSGRSGDLPAPVGTSQGALNSDSPTTGFAIYAQNSANLRDRVVVYGGDVGVKPGLSHLNPA